MSLKTDRETTRDVFLSIAAEHLDEAEKELGSLGKAAELEAAVQAMRSQELESAVVLSQQSIDDSIAQGKAVTQEQINDLWDAKIELGAAEDLRTPPKRLNRYGIESD